MKSSEFENQSGAEVKVCRTGLVRTVGVSKTKRHLSKRMRRKILKKGILFGMGMVVIFLIVFLFQVFGSLISSPKYSEAKEEGCFVLEDYKKIIMVHSSGETARVDGEDYGEFSGSINPGKVVISVINRDEMGLNETISLYYISEDGIREIANLGHGKLGVGRMSADGKSFVFYNKPDPYKAENDGDLSLFDGETLRTISTEAYYLSDLAISPDGKTIIFTTSDKEKLTGIKGYMWNDGETTEVGAWIYPLAVSNGGKLIYFEENGNLYVKKEGEEKRLLSRFTGKFYLNRDHTEIFVDSQDGMYVSSNGDEPIFLEGTASDLILPKFVARSDTFGIHPVTIDISNFKNTFYTANEGIFRITDKYKSKKITEKSDFALLAEDGKTIYSLSLGSIYRINGFDSSKNHKKIVDGSVFDFRISKSGKVICYISDSGELYYQKGTSASKLIDGGLFSGDLRNDEMNTIFDYDQNSDTVFYILEGELYASRNGEKGTRIEDVNIDGLRYVQEKNSIVETGENPWIGTSYWSLDGMKFHSMKEEK